MSLPFLPARTAARFVVRFPARLRPTLAGAAVAVLVVVGVGCSNRLSDEPGVGGVTDMPVALISATANDVTAAELYLVSGNGSTAPKLVPTFTGAKFAVRWSVDGRRLAIVGNTAASGTSASTQTADVWTVNADGTGLTRITNDGLSDSPAWLPDGRLIFARALPGNAVQYYAIPAGGGAPAAITLRGGQPVYSPDWSRTAGRLAFDESSTIYTAATDGTGEVAVATGTLPRWSRAGDRIAYFGQASGVPTLLIGSASGQGTPTRVASLVDFADFGGFTWTQDGRQVAWVRINAAGSPEAVIAPADGSAAPAVLVPRSPTVTAYDVDVDWRPTALP